MRKPNIILTGFMGTGKTVVGKALASALDMKYIDTDLIVEAEAKKSVSEIFETEGEAAFRRYESNAIRCITHIRGYVIATGGGAIMAEDNLANMKRAGMIVCLTATPEVIWDRTKNNRNRPLLQTSDPMKRIHMLLKIREPQYQKADLVLDTSTLTVDEVVEQITKLWQAQDS